MKKYIILFTLLTAACGPHRSGTPGTDGLPGAPGEGCTVVAAVGGALITCGDTSTLLLHGQNGANGQDGQDGQDGADAPPTAYTVVDMINPGGDGPGFDEVLLRLANGQLVAHFSSGGLQFLTILSPGNYVTTDAGAVPFTVGPAPGYSVTW